MASRTCDLLELSGLLASNTIGNQSKATLALLCVCCQKLPTFTEVTGQIISGVEGALEAVGYLQEAGSAQLTLIVDVVSFKAGIAGNCKATIHGAAGAVVNGDDALRAIAGLVVEVEAWITFDASSAGGVALSAVGGLARNNI